MDTNIHNNSLNGGGGNNNVIIRIPSKNEHSKILLNSDLNGTVDTTTSKSNVWNFELNKGHTNLVDFSILQDNSTYNFINLATVYNSGYGFDISYYNMDKSNTNIISYGNHNWNRTMPCFRPIFEFNQE